jgi:hypothetical protein
MILPQLVPIGPIWFENPIVRFLKNNMAVVIPLFILFLKVVVIRISGDVNELIHSIVVTPMEVLLISMGFIFEGLRQASFESQFRTEGEKDLAGLILIFTLSMILAFVYRTNKRAVQYFEKFTVALDNSRLRERQINLVFMPSHDPVSEEWATAWAVGYFLFAVLIWVLNLMIAIFVLWQTMLRIG